MSRTRLKSRLQAIVDYKQIRPDDLAKAAGMSLSGVYRLLAGDAPTLKNAAAIARAVDEPIERIWPEVCEGDRSGGPAPIRGDHQSSTDSPASQADSEIPPAGGERRAV